MGWLFGENWYKNGRLDGKTAVVTGSNSGVGYYTALDFYQRGCRVILACRNKTNSEDAVKRIKKSCKNKEDLGEISCVELDLSSLNSVRKCAQQLLKQEDSIHILVNNAGVVLYKKEKTTDGFEKQFVTNHLGHFLLTLLLLPCLIRSAPARVINVTSEPHCIANSIDFDDLNREKEYFYHTVYSQTKLANILFTNELNKRLRKNGVKKVTTYSVNPGAVDTSLSGQFASMILPGVGFLYSLFKGLVMSSGEQGARTTVYCAVAQQAAYESGLYYTNCKPALPPTASKNEKMAQQLWNISLKMVAMDKDFNPFVPS